MNEAPTHLLLTLSPNKFYDITLLIQGKDPQRLLQSGSCEDVEA